MNSFARHRPTPRQELAELTHSRIMSAVAVLLRCGTEDVTFDLVSRESGVPQRTIFRHFENKEALFDAFWTWMNRSIEMPAAPKSPDEVVAHVPALFDAFDRDERLVRAMLHNPHGRAVRLAHAEARRDKFKLALGPILEMLPCEAARNLLTSVTVLCSAAGWEMTKDTWQLTGASAGEAAQWAVRTLIDAAAIPPGTTGSPAGSSRSNSTEGRPA